MSKKYISDFILYSEYQCSCCSRLPPEFYYNGGGRVEDIPYLYRELFRGFKRIRERWKRPIDINSGYVCLKHQKELYKQGVKNTLISVHNFGLAFDLETSTKEETESLASLARKMCPSFRIGHRSYLYRGQTLVHIDTGYRISPSYSKKLVEGASW